MRQTSPRPRWIAASCSGEGGRWVGRRRRDGAPAHRRAAGAAEARTRPESRAAAGAPRLQRDAALIAEAVTLRVGGAALGTNHSSEDTPGAGAARSDDLLVYPGRNDAIDADRLRDVLEHLLAEALEHEVLPDPLGGGRPHDDVAALGERGEARRDVRGGAARGEGPPLARPAPELGGAHERLTGVDAHVERHGRAAG